MYNCCEEACAGLGGSLKKAKLSSKDARYNGIVLLLKMKPNSRRRRRTFWHCENVAY